MTVAAQDNVRLPDLGSSASALVSNQEMLDAGQSMVYQMRALGIVLDDPLVDGYINDLGLRLATASAQSKDHFAFLVVRDPVINAFAMPGGYIAVNSGLVLITRDQDELASVLAHEIGHITQNHLRRSFEDARKDGPLLALVMLGAIAAGAGSGLGAGDAAAAILVGGEGALAQKEINFTRKDEIEADRAGIQTLTNAGFDPNAMAEFFQRMQDTLRVDAGDMHNVPSLLLDHPVTLDRISDAKARAGALIAQRKQQYTATAQDRAQWARLAAPIPFVRNPGTLLGGNAQATLPRYALMRERIRVLTGDPVQLSSYYATNLAQHPDFDTPANHYGYALSLTLGDRGDDAVQQLQPLLARWPGDPVLRLALAGAQLQAGHRADALAVYAALSAESPQNHAIALAYAKALTDGGHKAQAAQAANLLRPLLDNGDEPDIYTSYARASEKAGDGVRAGEAFADAAYLSGRPFDALDQLQRLLKRNDLDYYARARIQARIAELTPLVLELRKRHIATDDNPDGRTQR